MSIESETSTTIDLPPSVEGHSVMKAVLIHQYGGSDVLQYEEIPVPEIAPDEVLIRVHSAGVNPIDWKVRKGLRKGMASDRLPMILGWDVSGIIESVGALVSRFKKGDKVFSRPDASRNGAYAEYIAVRSDEVSHAPTTIPLEQAAGVPLAALTAWMALFTEGKLACGQQVLVHAASGGVGSFAVQLAKLAGAKVIGTSSSLNLDLVLSLGADEAVDYRSSEFDALRDLDLVIDTVGGDTLAASYGMLKKGGSIITIAGKPDEEMASRLGVTSRHALVSSNGARLQEIAGLIDQRKLRVIIDREFMLSDVRAAHVLSESGHARGKIILRVA